MRTTQRIQSVSVHSSSYIHKNRRSNYFRLSVLDCRLFFIKNAVIVSLFQIGIGSILILVVCLCFRNLVYIHIDAQKRFKLGKLAGMCL